MSDTHYPVSLLFLVASLPLQQTVTQRLIQLQLEAPIQGQDHQRGRNTANHVVRPGKVSYPGSPPLIRELVMAYVWSAISTFLV